MGTFFSAQSGPITSGSTWKLADSKSFDITTATNYPTFVRNKFYSSSMFYIATSSIDAIAIQICENAQINCSMSVRLYGTGGYVAGTQVDAMLNSDIPLLYPYYSQEYSIWSVFKFSSPITTISGSLYSVGIACEVDDAVRCFTVTSGSTNWIKAIRTTVSEAPVSGSDLVICGEHMGLNSSSIIEVTANELSGSAITYGNGYAVRKMPGIGIGAYGKLKFNTDASSSYELKTTGNIAVGSLGTLEVGTYASPIPSQSLVYISLVKPNAGTIGIYGNPNSTVSFVGSSPTVGNSNVRCNISNSSTTPMQVDRITGWTRGMEIGIAAYGTTPANYMSSSLLYPATGSYLYLSSSLNETKFSSPAFTERRAEVVLLSRNIKVKGDNVAKPAQMVLANSNATMSWTEFRYMGASSPALDVQGLKPITVEYCSFRDGKPNNSYGLRGYNYSANYTFNNCILYGFSTACMNISPGNYNFSIISCSFINAIAGITLQSTSGSLRYNHIGGMSSNGITIDSIQNAPLEMLDTNITSIATGINVTKGVSNITSMSIYNVTTGYSITIAGTFVATIRKIYMSGSINTQAAIKTPQIGYINMSVTDFTASTCWYGVDLGNTLYGFCDITLNNGCVRSSSYACINIPTASAGNTYGSNNIVFKNTTFILNKSTSPTTASNNLLQNHFDIGERCSVSFENCEAIADITYQPFYQEKYERAFSPWTTYSSFVYGGSIVISPSDGRTGRSCMAMNPFYSSSIMESTRFKFPVSASQTLSASFYIKKSDTSGYITNTNYNGTNPSILLKADAFNERFSDTILATATASNGIWENVTVGLPISNKGMVYDIVVECCGTSGSVFIDNVTSIIG